MLNQSFTPENFRKIFDYENRKGNYLEGLFFPDLEKISQQLKTSTFNLKELKKSKSTLSSEEYEQKKQKINDGIEKLKENKERLLNQHLEKISNSITGGSYQLKVREVDLGKKGKAYNIERDVCGFFAIKQLQTNIKKLYKVEQANRFNVLKQLKAALDNEYPKLIFRTDIKNFYESIPTENVLKLIHSDNLLTPLSKKLIKQVILDYQKVSGATKGIPRGIGISAYISELYMRQIDRWVQHHPEVFFFARYVDDIILVATPKSKSQQLTVQIELKDKINALHLELNEKKTTEKDLTDPTQNSNAKFEYLGYEFSISSGSVDIDISSRRLTRYRKRLALAFESYNKNCNKNEKLARKNLINRIQFLTGNTRLLNNKKNALVGIYFSNSLITHRKSILGLDKYKNHLNTKIKNTTAQKRVDKLSFESGHSKKEFYKFSTAELSKIVKVWKHVS